MRIPGPDSGITGLLALIAVQTLCAAFFLADAAADALALGWGALRSWHFHLETVAALSLAAGVALAVRMLVGLLRRKAHLERSVSIAAGALHDVIVAHFRDWNLTPAEQDVAMLAIKGLSIAEIAALRGSAPGTVKAQLNAIYQKSGVTGRSGLLALLIEDLMADPLLPGGAAAA